MGVAILKKKIKKAGLEEIDVFHISVSNLPAACDIIITHESLMDRVKEKQPDVHHIAINDYLNAPEYDELIEKILSQKE
uniref:PTS EIIB type-2 domain-containing protein n=1 Tax=Virgibacillus oceani TaxID=1479511 RepID=A0A917M4R9_9BACI|nr:hypothetical protein GCM10011398_22430 [Virgibacillus oceani]